MLTRETLVQLDATAATLLRLADKLRDAGDKDGSLAASTAADATMAVLDLHISKGHAGA